MCVRACVRATHSTVSSQEHQCLWSSSCMSSLNFARQNSSMANSYWGPQPHADTHWDTAEWEGEEGKINGKKENSRNPRKRSIFIPLDQRTSFVFSKKPSNRVCDQGFPTVETLYDADVWALGRISCCCSSLVDWNSSLYMRNKRSPVVCQTQYNSHQGAIQRLHACVLLSGSKWEHRENQHRN